MAIADRFFRTAGALMTGAWGQPIIWRAWVASKLPPRSGRPRRSSRRRPSYEKGLPCFPRRAEAHERGATSCQSRLSYVTPEQLEACRLDPAWEAWQRMAVCVVCRECGAKLQAPLGGNKGHLWRRHQMTVCAYRAVYPGARIPSPSCTVISGAVVKNARATATVLAGLLAWVRSQTIGGTVGWGA